MSFSNAGNVWVWEAMGLYGRGGRVRLATHLAAHLASADAWIAKHRKVEALPSEPKAPKAPKAAPEPSAEALTIEAARARYGRIHPDAFHAKRSALRKGWMLVRGIPTWADALSDA